MGELVYCERRHSGRTRRELLLSVFGAALVAPAIAEAAGSSPIRRLVDLTGYGGTEKDYAAAESLGFKGYLEAQLNYISLRDRHMPNLLRYCQKIDLPILDLLNLPPNTAQAELQEATLLRAAFSERQLFEKMVEFWTNHFNIDMGKTGVMKIVDDREVIRRHALGSFPELLYATMKSPAMLHYLDNWESWFLRPNQNYAREFLELHTMGTHGGYTQQDVLEVARCFTGHRFYSEASDGVLRGQYFFSEWHHDNGAKVVFGERIPPNGRFLDLDRVFELVIEHPSTAAFISRKLCEFFLGESASASIVEKATQVFRNTQGDIKSVLRVILTKQSVAEVPQRIRRPFHFAAGALRRLNAFIYAATDTRSQLARMGMPVHGCSPPSGYSNSDANWTAALLPRWNFAINLLSDQVTGVSINIDALLDGATTASTIVDQIDRVLFFGKMTSSLKNQLVSYIGTDAFARLRARDTIAMALATPEQQVY